MRGEAVPDAVSWLRANLGLLVALSALAGSWWVMDSKIKDSGDRFAKIETTLGQQQAELRQAIAEEGKQFRSELREVRASVDRVGDEVKSLASIRVASLESQLAAAKEERRAAEKERERLHARLAALEAQLKERKE